jgi:hypothetical protein
VTFYSPGTFFDETSTEDIPEWNPATACRMARERYGAKPYAFRFSTYIVADPVSDGQGGTLEVEPKEVAKTGLYHLGGEIVTYDDIQARNDPKERILLSNMRSDSPICIVNTNSWKHTGAFAENDVLVNPDNGEELARGDAPKHIAYRRKVREDYNAELRREANYAVL